MVELSLRLPPEATEAAGLDARFAVDSRPRLEWTMSDSAESGSAQPEPVRRKLKLRRETIEHLRDDLFNLQAESLWTCPGDRIPRDDPETTYFQVDGVRVEVHIDVHETPRDQV
ncbi:hypothetical protein ACFQZZ_05505 [Nocardia sp. GCM10030253]|uniref:hypothetical protein n=1 Tax=Nocardia sp. GCM10030253 TaxID=3273404 RepID=UPI00362D4726